MRRLDGVLLKPLDYRAAMAPRDSVRKCRAFYAHLRGGQTMGAARRLALQKAIADGMPAATWAGIDLLGDADLSLAAPPRTRPSWPTFLLLGALVLALSALGWGPITRFAGR